MSSGLPHSASRRDAIGQPSARKAPATRLLAHLRGERPGPLLLCLSGLHGNEPAGVEALQRVISALAATPPPFAGDIIGVTGNLSALRAGRRFIDEDLNRIWQPERVRSLRLRHGESTEIRSGHPTAVEGSPSTTTGPGAEALRTCEAREQRELLLAIDAALGEARGPIYALDLHTTSAESPPFVTLGDTLTNRALAQRFPIPIILGLEEQLDGALLSYLDRRGLVGLGVEGGSHTSPDSVDALEAVLWIALVALGHLPSNEVPGLSAHHDLLERATRHLPRVMEVRHRHEVKPDDDFSMAPGFENFQPVRKGISVARDRQGPIQTPEGGRIFLPLYQDLGDDGFFIVRRVHPFWLKISAVLRRLGLANVAPLLPGVHRVEARDDALVVRPWAARDPVIGVLHLLGYRKRVRNGLVYMIRRKDKPGGYGS